MGVSQARSMVYFMENPKMKGMIWGTSILGNLHIVSDSYIKLHQSHYSPHYSQLVQVAIAFQIHAFPFFTLKVSWNEHLGMIVIAPVFVDDCDVSTCFELRTYCLSDSEV